MLYVIILVVELIRIAITRDKTFAKTTTTRTDLANLG